MRRSITLLFAFLLLIASGKVYSQTYLISAGGTITTCAGDFFDSGGSGGAYGSGENFTMTFHSNSGVYTHIRVNFNTFDIDPSDTLIAYDGPTTAAPVIGKYNNNNPLITPNNQVQASIYNATGDITFQFKSDGGTVNGDGWFASLMCEPMCQKVIAGADMVNMSPIPNDSNYVDICFGDSVCFVADTSAIAFPQNHVLYSQLASNCLFIWDLGDGTIDTGRVVCHKYNTLQGYDVYLRVIDSHGCDNWNLCNFRVRVSGNPFGVINPIPNFCSSTDTIEISTGYAGSSTIVITPINFHHSASQSFDSTMFIPDGPLCTTTCYNTEVTFSVFAPGAVVTQASDVQSICVNMEHSFVGDLGFTIICPNGQQVILDPNTHSGGMYFGNSLDGSPYDNSTYPCDQAYNTPGTGWTYCWSEIWPTVGTLDWLCNNNGGTIMDSTNQVTHSGYIQPENPLSGLIGCPLNGTWNIKICDDYGSDNGFIFNWTLNLDPSLLPVGWGYSVPIDSIAWSGPFIYQQLDSSILVVPDTGGYFSYTITLYDAFGCSYDTTLFMTIVQNPRVDLGPDRTYCSTQTIDLSAGNPGATYQWAPTGTGTTQTVSVNQSNIYSVTVTYSDGVSVHCVDADSVSLVFLPLPTANLGPDLCIEAPMTLDAGTGPTWVYLWQDGSQNQTYNVTQSGTYIIEVHSGGSLSSNCVAYDTVEIDLIPPPWIDLGPDTTICIQREVSLTGVQPGETDGTYQYMWVPLAVSTTDLTFSPNGVPGEHVIILNKTGCTTVSDTIIITGELCDVTIPNVFTPNEDPSNQTFFIKGLDQYPNTQVIIFNRWGRKVYESSNYQNDWDGEDCADGVYYYIINFIDYLAPAHGTVTIMR